jgi:hypothetical protein
MKTSFSIDARFCGPPGTANGGYVAGMLARGLTGAVEVTLRAPAPLASALEIDDGADGARSLIHAGRELARAVRTELELYVPARPPREIVEAHAGDCRAMRTHPFPKDFVCGPARAPGDGLRIFPGVVPGSERVAALWTPDPSVCDAKGIVPTEIVWAALDSPSSFPLLEPESARALEPMVLGRLCVSIEGALAAGERALVMAWPLARDGRRGTAGAALFADSGRRVAIARATWVSLAGRS